MLASPCPPEGPRFPVLASPKLDGVRCLIRDGVALSRKLEPIPNRYVQSLFGRPDYEGFDGELIVGKPTDPGVFQATMSGVMRVEGEPDVRFFVFDQWDSEDTAFNDRLADVSGLIRLLEQEPGWGGKVVAVPHLCLGTAPELAAYVSDCEAHGFEGAMVRDPAGLYKFGRSTAKEGGMLKVKSFADSEAEVIGVVELMRNANEAERDALGHTKRSKAKAGLVPAGVLGALKVRDIHTGVEFQIGSGFDAAQRAAFWAERDALPGRIARYRYFASGVVTAPRFPVFAGWRDIRDIEISSASK